MSSTTPNDSPMSAPILPMHNPSLAAQVVVPQAPLGNATNGASNLIPGMGVKALLAKKMAKSANPTYISPTDNFMTPVTKKLNAAKLKRFSKGAKPMGKLFTPHETTSSDEHDSDNENHPVTMEATIQSIEANMEEDANPF